LDEGEDDQMIVRRGRCAGDKDKEIKARYKEIKMRNEKLKAQKYAQYLKLTPTN